MVSTCFLSSSSNTDRGKPHPCHHHCRHKSDIPFRSGNRSTERLGLVDTGLGHHVVSRVKVLSVLHSIVSTL